MDRREFLKRGAAGVIAVSVLGRLPVPPPAPVPVVAPAAISEYRLTFDTMLRDLYKPAIQRELNKPSVLLEML